MTKFSLVILIVFMFLFASCSSDKDKDNIIIGSKKFTESVILGEIVAQTGASDKVQTIHRDQLGGTRVLWEALLKGEIDIYPEYTGTILKEILADKNIKNMDELTAYLDSKGIAISKRLGFNDTYALGMLKDKANKLHINSISDLAKHPGLKFAFTNEFMDRGDGWKGLRRRYNLPQKNVRGVDHDISYRGLAAGSVDVIDLYSTDAEIKYYDIKILNDDRQYFTNYDAVLLYRKELLTKYPSAMKNILRLENAIPESTMIAMNAEVKINKRSEREVAADFVKDRFNIRPAFKTQTWIDRLEQNTYDHLYLVFISLAAAILISIPLGIFSYKFRRVGQVVISVVGIIQTIPSLALLVFMIPFFGIGTKPAIVALFLYSLLPIVRNTYLGLENIPEQIKESAKVIGLTPFSILYKIEMPLSSRATLSGIKTSAVINVGTATLGALIGAGGYGQPILTGIRLDNISLILEGALPAAALALIVQGLFDLAEIYLVPKGLRIKGQ